MTTPGKLEDAGTGKPGRSSTPAWATSRQYHHGLDLFNAGRYFEAHEALEDVWRSIEGRERRFVQGLIQVAVAFHHHSRNNPMGARSLLQRAAANLASYPDIFGEVHTGRLRTAIGTWKAALENGGPEPRAVQILRVSGGSNSARMLESLDQ